MNRILKTSLILSFSLPLLLLAQRPQGMGADFVDAVTVGADLFGISNTGGTGNDGQIQRSLDAGETFTVLYTVPVSGDELYAVEASGSVVIAAGTDSVFHRADAGVDANAWTVIQPPALTFGDVRDLAANGNIWLAAGSELLRSANNGLSWSRVSPLGMDQMNAVTHNPDDGSWVAVGGSFFGGSAWRSTDGGLTWTAVNLPANTPPLLGVAADAAGNVLAVGEAGTVLELSGDGATFTAANLGTLTVSEDLRGIVSSGSGEWLIGGDQRVLIQLDSGGAEKILDGSSLASPGDTRALLILDDAVVMAGIESVPPPQITPGTTTSLEPVEVTLTEDPGVDGSYYTQDGNAPDNTATLYTAPFTVSEDLTVKAVSVKDGVYSTVVSAQYTVTVHTLTILPAGADMDLTLDTSVVGYTYQLQDNADLTDNAGWTDAGAPKSGTGSPLNWQILNPASPLNWRVEITPPAAP